MKKTKIALSLFLCVTLLFTLFIPAFAADDVVCEYVEAPKNYDNVAVPDDIDETVDWDGLVETIQTAILNGTVNVDIRDFNVAYNDANKAYIHNLIFDTPSLLRAIGAYSYYHTDTLITSFAFNDYQFSGDEYEEMLAVCEDAKTTLLYGIKGNDALSDAEKCLILHDRLDAWCEYDYQNLIDNTIPETSYCAYGPLGLHVSVCQGYSYAYQWMLDDLGIESYYTTSDEINHGWNMVYIDSEPYYIDVTWDDPVWDVSGRAVHNHFLLSYDTFSARHYGAADFSAEPDSTLYEDGFWTDALDTEIVYIDGMFYYLAPVADSSDYALLARDADGTVTTEKTFTYKWSASGGGYWMNPHAKLTQYGDKLLYSTPADIRLYDPATDAETVVYTPTLETGESIYGFTQIDGTLIVEKGTTPNYDDTTKANGQITQAYCTEHTNRELLKEITPASASATGSGKFICTDCRKVFTGVIPMHEHSYGEWTTVTAATCNAKGSRTRTCTGCGTVDTAETEIDPANHTGGTEVRDIVTATCTTAGFTGNTYCLGCNAKIADGTATGKDASNHTGGTEIKDTVTATCATAGYTGDTYCLGCNMKIADGTATGKDASNHTGGTEIRDTVTATCKTAGYTGDTYCLGCNTKLATGTSTGKDASNHEGGTENREAIAVTCVADGYEAGVICLGCGSYVSGGKKISVNKNAHPGSYVSKPAKAPDCTNDGYTEEKKCTACGLTLVYSEPVPAPGHDYRFVKTVAPTCTAKGYDEYKCSVCSDVKKDNYTGTAAHSYTSEVIAPTCTKGGYTVYICTVCQDTYKADTTSATGHRDDNADGFCDVCSADLSPEATCACKCHKSGIAGFFFKIKVFFWKLFGMEQKRICECGKAHW